MRVNRARVKSSEKRMAKTPELPATQVPLGSALEKDHLERDRLFNLTVDLLGIFGSDGSFIQINPAWEHIVGWPLAELKRKKYLDLVHPDDHESTLKAIGRLTQGESLIAFRNRYLCADGSYKWLSWDSYPLREEHLILAIGRDVTEAKRIEDELEQYRGHLEQLVKKRTEEIESALYSLQKTNRALKTLSECNQALVRAENEPELLNSVCDILLVQSGFSLVWIGIPEEAENKAIRIVAYKGCPEDCTTSNSYSWAENEPGNFPAGVAIRTREISVSNDVPNDPTLSSWHGEALRSGYKSVIALPLISGNELLGVLVIHASAPNVFDTKEINLLRELGSDLAYGMRSLRTRSAHLKVERALLKSEARLLLQFNKMPSGCIVLNRAGHIDLWNPSAERIFGYSVEEAVGKKLCELVAPKEQEQQYAEMCEQLLKSDDIVHLVATNITKDGKALTCEWTNTPLKEPDGTHEGALCMAQDISDRKRMENSLQLQVDRLSALRTIDQAIAGSIDIHIVLSVILDQIAVVLKADAMDILLQNPHSHRLEFAAQRGFHTSFLRHTKLTLGEGYAGQAALERRIVHITNLQAERNSLKRAPLLDKEGVVTYFGSPLIAKGQVKGVLEVFYRKPFHPDQDWLDFLQAISGQAAIAIDNAALFSDLQRSTSELAVAYDSTLEGWSRALDLRDKETEGHTVRVTELTQKLARMVGINEEQLVHVRRGALLHDIGKMAIPDSILLKPGPLTDEEWVIMRKHSTYAYELLHPIAYLRPALDIPYCHHEKWDGSGYPRGLKEEQIPLAARIFAIIDVWDAIRSDRPYRTAWSEEKAKEYMASQSGIHFDPQILNAFLSMISTVSEEEING